MINYELMSGYWRNGGSNERRPDQPKEVNGYSFTNPGWLEQIQTSQELASIYADDEHGVRWTFTQVEGNKLLITCADPSIYGSTKQNARPNDLKFWVSGNKWKNRQIGISVSGQSKNFSCEQGIYIRLAGTTVLNINSLSGIIRDHFPTFDTNNPNQPELHDDVTFVVGASLGNGIWCPSGFYTPWTYSAKAMIPKDLVLTAIEVVDKGHVANEHNWVRPYAHIDFLHFFDHNVTGSQFSWVDRDFRFVGEHPLNKDKYVIYEFSRSDDISVDWYTDVKGHWNVSIIDDISDPFPNEVTPGRVSYRVYSQINNSNYVDVSFSLRARFDGGATVYPLTSAITGIELSFHVQDNSTDLFQSEFMWGISGEVKAPVKAFLAEQGKAYVNVMLGYNNFLKLFSHFIGDRIAFINSGSIITDYVSPRVTVIINGKRIGSIPGVVSGTNLSFVLPQELYLGTDVRYDRWPYNNFEK